MTVGDDKRMRIGIDLGGTKIELIALSDDGIIKHRERTSTPSGDYDATVKTLVSLVESAERALDPLPTEHLPIGVGIPGTISPASGLVKNANSTCLIGKALDHDLAQALNRPVRLANDADCFALSEAVDGAGAGNDIVFGVILGTGVGGGLVVGKHIVRGPNAITGEWGHNPLPWPTDAERPGPDCYCGLKGCIETFLSGPDFVRDTDGTAQGWSTAEDVIEAARQSETDAQNGLARYCERLARALASVINVIDPHVIVLGGGLSNVQEIYERVPNLWTPYVFSDTVTTKLAAPVHGDSGGARGAAWLWPM